MENYILIVSLFLAVLYGLFFVSHKGNNFGSFAKTASIGLLSFYVYTLGGPWFLMLALVFSALGDLALSRSGERPFIIGLFSFAIAHICYIFLFAPHFQDVQITVIIGFLSLAASTYFWLLPYTGKLRLPVMGYILILSTMGIFAFASGKSSLVSMGTASFVLSDLLLSIRIFRVKDDPRWSKILSLAVWVFYYGGQFILMKGWLGF